MTINRPIIINILILILFSAISFGIYSNTFKTPFIFDDITRIQNNNAIRMTEINLASIQTAITEKSSEKTRPIGYISFAVNYYFHKYNITGYHIVNTVIHILSGFFLFLFLKATLFYFNNKCFNLKTDTNLLLIALFSSLIWLVQPLHTQSITYIVQRLNSMAAMFYILSFWLFVKGRISQREKTDCRGYKIGSKPVIKHRSFILGCSGKLYYMWFIGAFLSWLLALGSKEMAITLPFIILLYEFFFFQDLNTRWIRYNLKYFFWILIFFSIIAFIFLGPTLWNKILILNDFWNREFTVAGRALTQFRVVIYYLSLIFYPHPSRLNFDYDFSVSHSLIDPGTTLLSFIAIAGVLVLACYLAKKERLISFCIFWFFSTLVIESSIIPLAIIFEHRTYLPSMLTFFPIVLLIYRLNKYRRTASVCFCIIAVIFSVWTYQRNHIWRDGATLWADSVSKSPEKARPHNNLGAALEDKGFLNEAFEHYSRALEIDPTYDDASINLGVLLKEQGRINDAIKLYRNALRVNPGNSKAHYNLGIALEDKKQPDEAIKHYLQAIKFKPANSNAHINLGIALTRTGELNRAIEHFSIALKSEPDSFDIHNNLGNALNQKGLLDKAIEHYLIALKINPDYLYGHINLGIAFIKKGSLDKAAEQFSTALQIDPDSFDAHNNLGNLLSREKQYDDAVDHYSKALRVNPDSPNTYNNLGVALLHKGDIKDAIDAFNNALGIRPDFTDALNNLEQALMQKEEKI